MRKLISVIMFASFFTIVNSIVNAEVSSPEAFHSQVVSIYSFQPHTIDSSERSIKAKEMDKFLGNVKKNQSEMLPLLRVELEKSGNPSFFYYDGAKLLLSVSNKKPDLQLALNSIPNADLLDVDSTDYLLTVHSLAINGLDTNRAALHILDDPTFTAFIPQHALTLGQNYCLIYMLFSQKNVPFEQELIGRLRTEKNVESQKSIILSLWYLMTPSSRKGIEAFVSSSGTSSEVVSYGNELLSRKVGFKMSLSSEGSLRSDRTDVMRRPISDEALMEFDSLTQKLMGKL